MSEDINIGAITEALNDKEDRNLRNTDTGSGADAVVEYQLPTADNNYTWYRKYASGWVEQGGRCNISQDTATTVNLPVEMYDLQYNILITARKDGATQTGGDGNFTADPISSTQFYWRNGDDFTGYGYWEVKGMSAS